MTNILNYRRILLSSVVIAFVASLVFAGTQAFFSDTETSTGNTFTAGAIDLKIDSEQHYNNAVCTNGVWVLDEGEEAIDPQYPVLGESCGGTWELTDLEDGVHTFFNFLDIKPGDEGENTISLHIDGNPAWACIDINLTKNDDVSSNEPELAAGDDENTDSIFDGELAQNLKFAAWLDQGSIIGFQGEGDPEEGDNIWQGEDDEPMLFSNDSGPASDVLGGKTYALADSNTGFGPIPGGETQYIGLAWCAGTQAIVGDTLTCDGAGMGNEAQTDEMVADITFRVEQSRNNDQFECGSVFPEPDATSLRLENETEVVDGPWIVHSDDDIFADLTWEGDGDTFNYDLVAQGLAASTAYSLIYYADGWPGNNPGAFIGQHTTDGSGAFSDLGNSVDLGVDMPTSPDGNLAVGAKIWLVLSADYNGGALSTGPMTAWNPSQYLFEGNVYIHYDDTDSI